MTTAHVQCNSLVGAAIILSCLSPILAEPAAAGAVPKWLEPSDEVVSPHIAWAKPSANGQFKILFITYRTAMREIVEISQRFDIDREVFAISEPDRFSGGSGGDYQNNDVFDGIMEEDQQARLREKLGGEYDLIVVGDIKWDVLPEWARQQIAESVAGGTGLVGYIQRGTDEFIKELKEKNANVEPRSIIPAFPFSGLPAFSQHSNFESFVSDTVHIGRHGDGRVVLLKGFVTAPKQFLTPAVVGVFPDYHVVHYDYYLALVGHLFSYAAGQSPVIRVVQGEMDVNRVDRGEFDKVQFNVWCQTQGYSKAEFVIRDAKHGTVLASRQRGVSLKAGDNTVSFELSNVPAGSYFADLWIKQNDSTAAYGSICINVSSKSHIAGITLDEDPLSEHLIGGGYSETMEGYSERKIKGYSSAEGIKTLRKDQPVVGVVMIANPQAGQHVQISQWDIYGRMVAQVSKPIHVGQASENIAFHLDAPNPQSVAQYLHVELISSEEVLDQSRQTFLYRDLFLEADDFSYILGQYYGGESYLNSQLARVVREAGFDTWLNQPYDTNYHFVGAGLLEGLYSYPYVYDDPVRPRPLVDTAMGEPIISSQYGDVRQPCLTDPKNLELMRKVFREAGSTWSRFAISAYDLGGECVLTEGQHELCFSQTCIADFRRFLQLEYGSLERLNEGYGSSFQNWQEIIPIDYMRARKEGPIPMWIDYRRHMDSVWASYFAIARDTISQIAPGAYIGYSASNDPGHEPHIFGLGGSDYWKLAAVMDFNNIYYYPMQLDCTRDFMQPPYRIGGGWFGGYRQMWRAGRDPLHHRWWIWNMVLKGANAITVWQGSAGGSGGEILGTTIAPDFSRYDFFEATVEEITILKSGIAKLLSNFNRSDDGIAVLYSHASMLASNFTLGFPEGWNIPACVPMIFEEAGFQYRMISSEQLENGALSNDDFRLLYLPYCQALSPSEVEAILTFAKTGGTVVADLRPAVSDEHGKVYPSGALNELFGVRLDTGQPAARSSTVMLGGDLSNLTGTYGEVRVDASVSRGTATAYGKARSVHEEMVEETPVLLLNTYGRGKGILLNIDSSETLMDRLNSSIRFIDEEKAEFAKSLIQDAFALADIKPAVSMKPYVPGCHVYRFDAGGTQILGILWTAPQFMPGAGTIDTFHPKNGERDRQLIARLAAENRPVELALPGKRHLYDTLTGEYLGYFDRVKRDITRGRVQLISALPYKVHSVVVQLKQSQLKQASPLVYNISVRSESPTDTPDLHVFRVELVDPTGKKIGHYLQKVRAEAGRCQGTIQLSLNEEVGQWTLTATDVTTGIAAETTFTISPSEAG